ncbi:MAG TPA: response regulator transcription factor [Bacteroidia bacterium]|nr:response regulator transcription factor [Bacteroidia bacterium]HNU33560.1 response regulator transcription factor [Bacteroidia bacterium]
MSKKIKIIIVEDDKEIRELAEGIVSAEKDMQVIKTFANGEIFLKLWQNYECDVVLMDINMPGKNGIECIAEAKPQKPSVQFLVCTVFENPNYIFQALCSGATGYMLKNNTGDKLVNAIREISNGGSPMSASIARLVVDSFSLKQSSAINNSILTSREKEILDLLAQGLMYKEIAAKKEIGVETVRKHVYNIYEKLQVNSRTEAINKVYGKNI